MAVCGRLGQSRGGYRESRVESTGSLWESRAV